jgi:hypothetical protein
LHEYLKDFQTRVQVLEHYGAVLGADGPHQDSVMDKVKTDSDFILTDKEYDALAVATARKKIIGIGFLRRADRKRYDGLWIELENQFTRGQDHYPNDLTGVYNLLINYKVPSSRHQGGRREHTSTDEVSGLSFLQNSAAVPGTNGVTHASIKCYNCQGQGHYASVCPVEDEVTMVQVETPPTHEEAIEEPYLSKFTFLHLEDHSFHQRSRNIIPDTWILLDSQSTVSVFKNRQLLTNIQNSPSSLHVHTNGGIQYSSQLGTVKTIR